MGTRETADNHKETSLSSIGSDLSRSDHSVSTESFDESARAKETLSNIQYYIKKKPEEAVHAICKNSNNKLFYLREIDDVNLLLSFLNKDLRSRMVACQRLAMLNVKEFKSKAVENPFDQLLQYATFDYRTNIPSAILEYESIGMWAFYISNQITRDNSPLPIQSISKLSKRLMRIITEPNGIDQKLVFFIIWGTLLGSRGYAYKYSEKTKSEAQKSSARTSTIPSYKYPCCSSAVLEIFMEILMKLRISNLPEIRMFILQLCQVLIGYDNTNGINHFTAGHISTTPSKKVVNDYVSLRKVYDIIKPQNTIIADKVEIQIEYLRDSLLDFGTRFHSISLDQALKTKDISQPLQSSFVSNWVDDYQALLEHGFESHQSRLTEEFPMEGEQVPNLSREISLLELQVQKLKANVSNHESKDGHESYKSLNSSIRSWGRDQSKIPDVLKISKGSKTSIPLRDIDNLDENLFQRISRGTNTSLLSRDIDRLEESIMSMTLSASRFDTSRLGSVQNLSKKSPDEEQKLHNLDPKSSKTIVQEVGVFAHVEPKHQHPQNQKNDQPMDVLDLGNNEESQNNVDAFIQGLTRSNAMKEFQEHSTIHFHEEFNNSVRDLKSSSGRNSLQDSIASQTPQIQDVNLNPPIDNFNLGTEIAHPNSHHNLSALPREATIDSFLVHQSSQVVVPFMKSRMAKAIQLVNRHLVFDTNQKSIDYFQIYKNGLLCGRLANTVCKHSFQALVKPLHPTLREIFILDIHILSELLKEFDFPSVNVDDPLETQLSDWIIGLESLHRHFIPLSKSIFKIEETMKISLRLEETLVLVRDYISLSKISQSNLLREDEVSKIHSTVNQSLGEFNLNSSRIMGSMIQLSDSFSNWLQVLLDEE